MIAHSWDKLIKQTRHLLHSHPKNSSGLDSIIIGAGLGGLSTAILLAKKGHRVLVLEKNATIGGYASQVSYNNTAFDLGAQDITILGKEGMSIVRQLRLDDILQPINPHGVSIYPNHRFVWDSGSTKETKNYLLNSFPAEAIALQQFFKEMVVIYKEMDRYLTPQNIQGDPHKFPHLVRYRNYTAEQFLKEFFSDNTLISLLSSYCLFYQGMPVSSLTALHFIGLLQSYFDTGAFYARGGIGALSEKLYSYLKELGGQVEVKTEVKSIIVDGSDVIGVFLADGRQLNAGAIVANIDPRILYSKLLPESVVSESIPFKRKSNHLSRCQLYASVDDDAPALPFVTFYATTYDKEQEYQAFISGYPLSIRIFSPPGKPRTLSIAMPAAYEMWRAAIASGTAEYETMKQTLTTKLVRLLLNAYPELTGKIQVLGMTTPVDLENFSGNCNGSLYGADAIPEQSGTHSSSIALPFPGLFLTGQWVSGGSATLVFRGASLSACTVDKYLKKRY